MVAPMAVLRALPVLALVVLAGACGRGNGRCDTPRASTPLDPSTVGTITGTVVFQGTPPPMKSLPLSGDPQCAAQHPGPVLADDALVRDGRVENVFVYVRDGLGERTFAVPDTPVTIDQVGCVYRPHVIGAQTCQPIQFVNSDALLHNVHGMPERSAPWNFGMAVKGSKRTVRIEKPEVAVEVRCDVHPWMRAYLGVVSHPYFAVTGADGRFTLADVPPGDYVVASWHERFGTRESRVTLGAKETKQVSFTYPAGP
jgi:plastocyanin